MDHVFAQFCSCLLYVEGTKHNCLCASGRL